jgi:hypothetical protein
MLIKAFVNPGKKKSGSVGTTRSGFYREVFTTTNFFTDTFLDRFELYRWLADCEGAWLLKASWFLEV